MTIILLTARSQPEDCLTAAALGADAHMNKPLNPDELLAESAGFLPATR
jgi:DNA-binding response OmpR family regulator